MTEEFKKQIETEARQAVTELLAQAKLKKGDVFVVGCSSSEIVGGHIGKDSSLEAAQAVYAGVAPVLAENGIWLAAQCCEHLNRAIIIEREAAEKYGWEEVCVVPYLGFYGHFSRHNAHICSSILHHHLLGRSTCCIVSRLRIITIFRYIYCLYNRHSCSLCHGICLVLCHFYSHFQCFLIFFIIVTAKILNTVQFIDTGSYRSCNDLSCVFYRDI